jgi:GDP-L-fucose synthase
MRNIDSAATSTGEGLTPEFWRQRRILITGGRGFLGRHIVDRLEALGVSELILPRRSEFDLTEQADVRRLMEETRPDMVLHLAAEVGGIGANRENPGRFFYANAMMGILLIEEARRSGVEKFVQVGTICAYPKFTPVPFQEDELWNGYPEETNAPYGIAKKALLVQLQAYRAQYGFNGIYLLPVNLYGPHDNFDPASSHVIPALIRKMVEAREDGAESVQIWGTGKASREFLYVDDCARGILLAAERYDDAEPVNLGTGGEISIADLAEMIRKLVGFEGELRFDPSQPDGQPRRCLDTTRARERFGFAAQVEFREGLEATIEWFEKRSAAMAEANSFSR